MSDMPSSDAPSSAMPSVVLDHIHMSYDSGQEKLHVLDDLSLYVKRGESVAIVGPSGAGKSTLLMILAGLERPQSGVIAVNGQDLQVMNNRELTQFRGAHIGIVFQSFHLIPTMRAVENVALPLDFLGQEDAFERAQKMLRAVGLGQRENHYPSQLSGGEQQRVAVARALAIEPSVVIADEPTGNLDEKTGHLIADLLFEQARDHGSSLILVTHDKRLAKRCERVLFLHQGKLSDHDYNEDTAKMSEKAS